MAACDGRHIGWERDIRRAVEVLRGDNAQDLACGLPLPLRYAQGRSRPQDGSTCQERGKPVKSRILVTQTVGAVGPSRNLRCIRGFELINVRLPLALTAILLLCCAAAAQEQDAVSLEAGYGRMYNLQFDEAHRIFRSWEQAHPADPLGPVSDAAAYLFSEFDRLHVLESELFTDDAKFESRSKLAPDPQARQAFEQSLNAGQQIADRILAGDRNNPDALFAEVMIQGLRGDYAALIEKRDLAGLSYMKSGRALAERLLAGHPTYYDAYLAVGVENYLLSLKPAPMRWFLRITGAQTDREAGLQKLRITAEQGHYLLPYARLLLAVAAIRDHRPEQARQILEGLSREFPHNKLYAKELAKLQ